MCLLFPVHLSAPLSVDNKVLQFYNSAVFIFIPSSYNLFATGYFAFILTSLPTLNKLLRVSQFSIGVFLIARSVHLYPSFCFVIFLFISFCHIFLCPLLYPLFLSTFLLLFLQPLQFTLSCRFKCQPRKKEK